MDVLGYLFQGLMVALQPYHLLLITLGGILGTIVGMLPGLGPATGVAVLLPMTFSMSPTGAIITMAGVYYGAMFGGSRSSILINTPGDGAALAATFDGYPMARNGRAEAALAISGIASFIGGLVSVFFLVVLAVPVAKFALKFGPAEYFLLMIAALAMTSSMSKGNLIKGLIGTALGLMISTIGIDAQSGISRFTFGMLELQSGVDFLVIIIALYALGEVFKAYKDINAGHIKPQTKFGKIWITKDDWKQSWKAILRSTPLGFFVGALPGAGGTMASLMAYNNEKQMSKDPDSFGKGNITGLAAPEAANNAASVGAFIPMLTLGIPGSGTTAIMMGALLMLGIQPGPLFFTQYPQMAWGLIASMIVGNFILAVINIPMAGLLVRVLAVPAKVLYPIILGLAFVGTYAISNSVVDFYILLLVGVVGFFMAKVKFPTSSLILAVIVGNTMEQSFRQAINISDGDFEIFYHSPLAKALILVTLVSLFMPTLKVVADKLKSSVFKKPCPQE
ncbi:MULTISPECIES: tripartite tricarboxylate transporter permease [unclassified Fusibacter]|uniref:tripartite tricarboxylate transporter permease n=1 Tax=unclassified Fusibacter TaxID=2624464 RepID=UPI0010133DB2|nr:MULTISPECIES: tripartite tricarboxylate transporter permease [unclassified Fusibacter]MCK8058601.1 tripartite tricarboxylate transporter permease [Fusibacter sp. A2]NPE22629.1 tripartite tricarboxylate transporter permease [Fusibacter sp. A1]RXV60193.1 tripartite tricarboxylate transporter permease [Fusibacter sp. A1]